MALTGRRPAQIFFSATFSLPRKDEGLGGWSLPRGGCRTQPGVSTPGTSNQMDSPTRHMNVRSRKNTRFAGLEMLQGREIGGRYQGRILYGNSVLLAPLQGAPP